MAENLYSSFRSPLDLAKVYDRFGRTLDVGDVVYLIGKQDVMWHVQNVAVVLDPNSPPGIREVTLVTSFTFMAPGGTPLGDILKAVDAAQMRPPKTEGTV